MTKKIRVADLPEFDIAEHLDSVQAMAEYLTVVLEENDPAALAGALGSIARARGMSEIAKASGLTREALYRALRPDAQPRFDTISRVCAALGVKLVAPRMRYRLRSHVLGFVERCGTGCALGVAARKIWPLTRENSVYAIRRHLAAINAWCWRVNFRRRGKGYSKSFYDAACGGSDAANRGCFFTPILAFPHQGGRNIRFSRLLKG
jgi:probable addiction module antidote protein